MWPKKKSEIIFGHKMSKDFHLLGGFNPYPSEKWWTESQLGWWHSIPHMMGESYITRSKPPISHPNFLGPPDSSGIWMYPLALSTVCELENGPVEIVDFPMKIALFSWWIFPVRYLNVYQRVWLSSKKEFIEPWSAKWPPKKQNKWHLEVAISAKEGIHLSASATFVMG